MAHDIEERTRSLTETDVLEILYRVADRMVLLSENFKSGRLFDDVLFLLNDLVHSPNVQAWRKVKGGIESWLKRSRLLLQQAERVPETLDMEAVGNLRYAGRLAALILTAAQAKTNRIGDNMPETVSVKLEANGIELPLTALLQTFDREIGDLVDQRAAGIVQGRFEERLAEIDVLLDDFVEKLGLKIHGEKHVMDMADELGIGSFGSESSGVNTKGGTKTYG